MSDALKDHIKAPPGMSLFGRERKLVFHGQCLELLYLCEAACCRKWDIELTPREQESGLYTVEEICRLTSEECTRQSSACGYRKVRLRMNADKSCIYLRDDKRCSIYETRPQVCAHFECKAGWYLSGVVSTEEKSKEVNEISDKEDFIAKTPEGIIFILHPLLRLQSIFYLKEKGEVIFISKMIGGCMFGTIERDVNQKVSEDDLLSLVGLFNGDDTLLSIYQQFRKRLKADLEKKEFYELVWILLKNSIILDSRFLLEGMLAGKKVSPDHSPK